MFLRCFYVMSGLKINVSKSNLIGIGVESNAVRDMALVLGCGVSSLSFTYLGFQLVVICRELLTGG